MLFSATVNFANKIFLVDKPSYGRKPKGLQFNSNEEGILVNTLLKPFYAVVPLSLEELFAEELKKLGIEKFRLEKGGCWFGAEMSQMMQVNLWTRYASRILLKVAEGPYRTEEDIYKLAKSFRWEQYFTPKNTFKIELSSRRSRSKASLLRPFASKTPSAIIFVRPTVSDRT